MIDVRGSALRLAIITLVLPWPVSASFPSRFTRVFPYGIANAASVPAAAVPAISEIDTDAEITDWTQQCRDVFNCCCIEMGNWLR
jgi:hypothetical protein